eukprot:3024886-Pyramimonas_sp.AAC.1
MDGFRGNRQGSRLFLSLSRVRLRSTGVRTVGAFTTAKGRLPCRNALRIRPRLGMIWVWGR